MPQVAFSSTAPSSPAWQVLQPPLASCLVRTPARYRLYHRYVLPLGTTCHLHKHGAVTHNLPTTSSCRQYWTLFVNKQTKTGGECCPNPTATKNLSVVCTGGLNPTQQPYQ